MVRLDFAVGIKWLISK